MPVVHKYKGGSGIYLRSRIDGAFVTFQIKPEAQQFFAERKIGNGDRVSWKLIKPLWERGLVYTGQGGVDYKPAELDASDAPSLDSSDKDALDKFLKETEANEFAVPSDMLTIFKDWFGAQTSVSKIQELLVNADDMQEVITSISRFADYSLDINGFDTNGGNAAYTVSVKGLELQCVDLRESTRMYDFIILFRTATSRQSFKIVDGKLDSWYVYESDEDEIYQRDAFKFLPSVVELLLRITDYEFLLDTWDFQHARGETIPSEVIDIFEIEVRGLSQASDTDHARKTDVHGTIESLSEIGYGIIASNSGQRKVIFSLSEASFPTRPSYTDSESVVGHPVVFDLCSNGGQIRGCNLRLQKDEAYSNANHPITGEIQFLDERRGYGHIICDDFEKSGFFFVRDIEGSPVNVGDRVVFEPVPDGDGFQAFNVSQIGIHKEPSSEGWEINLPEEIIELILKWSSDPEHVFHVLKPHLLSSGYRSRLIRSLQNTSHLKNFEVTDITVSDEGNVAYVFELEEGNWTCTCDLTTSLTDFELRFFPSRTPNQIALIQAGYFVYWGLLSSPDMDPLEQQHLYILTQSEFVQIAKDFFKELRGYSLKQS
jgi:cold shock CspA family protein